MRQLDCVRCYEITGDPRAPPKTVAPIHAIADVQDELSGGPGDARMVQRISADAYIPAYMSVLGTIPRPATEDYGPRISRGRGMDFRD